VTTLAPVVYVLLGVCGRRDMTEITLLPCKAKTQPKKMVSVVGNSAGCWGDSCRKVVGSSSRLCMSGRVVGETKLLSHFVLVWLPIRGRGGFVL
jgi:hypothetical protein